MEQLVDRRVEAAVQQALNQAMEQGIIGVSNGDGGNNGVNCKDSRAHCSTQ